MKFAKSSVLPPACYLGDCLCLRRKCLNYITGSNALNNKRKSYMGDQCWCPNLTDYLNRESWLLVIGGYWLVVVWFSSGVLVSINKVNLRWTRLVLGRVTMSRFNSWCVGSISVCNQPPRSTQPGHSFVGRQTEYQQKGGDALRLGIKAGMVRMSVAGKTV